jgi:hypothetical protein
VKVLYSEGLANHAGLESCAGVREDEGEALTGGDTGRVLSRERLEEQGADVLEITEGHTGHFEKARGDRGAIPTVSSCMLPVLNYAVGRFASSRL